MDEVLAWVQTLYLDQCDGDWEHEFGITIDTIDNPGWRVAISISRTSLETKQFDRIEVQRSEHDWYFCWVGEVNINRVNQLAFHIACGPENLVEALRLFQAWAGTESSSMDVATPICRRCGRPVTKNADQYEVFERMHWVCFHYEYEHGDDRDPDQPCADPGCPSREE